MTLIRLKLRALMDRSGVSQGKLATAAGLSEITVSRYRKGQVESWNIEILGKLATVLGVTSLDQLFELVPDAEAPHAAIAVSAQEAALGTLTTAELAGRCGVYPSTPVRGAELAEAKGLPPAWYSKKTGETWLLIKDSDLPANKYKWRLIGKI